MFPGAYKTAEENFDLEKGSDNETFRPLSSTSAAPPRGLSSSSMTSVGPSKPPQDRELRVSPDMASTPSPSILRDAVDVEDSPTLQ